MTDLIIRKPYPYRDERLYPVGWRSFLQEIFSLNRFEVFAEVIGINKISGEIPAEFISINDITSLIESEIVGINSLEVFSEIISLNDLIEPSIRETISLNILSTDHIPEFISVNDLLDYNGPYEKETVGINILRGDPSFVEYSYIIKIFLDEVDVTDYILDWSVTISEENYVNSGKITFTGKEFFTQSDPTLRIKEKRIKITIDDIDYKFLLEKRNVSRNPEDGFFSIWGRSHIAILDAPYAIPITDKEIYQDSSGNWICSEDSSYVPHIWQTNDRMASEIMENVIDGNFSLELEIDDFVVKKDSFVVSNETPIEIINRLAKVIGGQVRTDLDDKVIVRYEKYDTTGSTEATFYDTEGIHLLEERVDFPEGYNRILVRGPKDDLAEQNMNLEIVLDDDLNEEKTTFIFGSDIWLRVYRSPFDLDYEISCSLGEITLMSSSVSEVISKESTGFSGKSLETFRPINSVSLIERYDCTNLPSTSYEFNSGYKTITSESGIEDEPVLVTYSSKYDLYLLRVEQPCDPLTFDEVISRIVAEYQGN